MLPELIKKAASIPKNKDTYGEWIPEGVSVDEYIEQRISSIAKHNKENHQSAAARLYSYLTGDLSPIR